MVKFIILLNLALIPEEGQPPTFSQLYIYDTENEIRNRLNIMHNLDATILRNLQNMLDRVNPYAHIFRQEISYMMKYLIMYKIPI